MKQLLRKWFPHWFTPTAEDYRVAMRAFIHAGQPWPLTDAQVMKLVQAEKAQAK